MWESIGHRPAKPPDRRAAESLSDPSQRRGKQEEVLLLLVSSELFLIPGVLAY